MRELPKDKRVRLSDIAREAGVSVSLVSRILSQNMGNVTASEALVARVQQIAQDSGYTPDRRARSLKTGKNMMIAVMLPMGENFTLSVYPRLLQGIVNGAKMNEYDLVFQHYFGMEDEVRGLKAVQRMSIDGLIYAPDPAQEKRSEIVEMLGGMLKKGIEVIFCMDKYDIPGTYYYAVDDYAGMRIAVENIIARKHQRILYMHYFIQERLSAVLETAEKAGVSVEVAHCAYYSQKDGYEAMCRYLEENQSPPKGIVAVCDAVALGILRALEINGYDVSQFDIMGYDDLEYMSLFHYRLASMRQPVYEVGFTAARNMLSLMHNKKVESALFIPELVYHNTNT